MSTLHKITFEMPDGTVESRLYEGPASRDDRDSITLTEIAELLRIDRGAISAMILPYTPPRSSLGVATPNAGPLAAVSHLKG